MTPRRYTSPEAFKQALEQRLRSSAKTGADFARKRQLLVFDRCLARVVAVLGDTVMLKGGLVLELRIERARTTKDIDLRMVGSPDGVLAKLQEAGRKNLDDFMTFEVAPDNDHPEIQNDGMQYDGLRFRAECKLAGKVYGQPFGIDVAFGDPILGEPEVVVTEDALGFAGIAPPVLRLYPIPVLMWRRDPTWAWHPCPPRPTAWARPRSGARSGAGAAAHPERTERPFATGRVRAALESGRGLGLVSFRGARVECGEAMGPRGRGGGQLGSGRGRRVAR
jgi:hypothetical protein